MPLFQTLTLTAQRRMISASRVIEHARAIYRARGARELFASMSSHIGRRLGMRVGKRAAYLRHQEKVDRQFDTQLGTDTGGVQNLFTLTIAGENARHGGTHIAVDPTEFANGIHDLGIDPSAFTFVDLGSGKGRALLLAAEHGFQQVIGVEFALELHQVATANVAAFETTQPSLAGRIQTLHADATTFAAPNVPLVVYLFNPFDAVICRKVAKNLLASWKANPRPFHIYYKYPLEIQTWLEEGWRITKNTGYHVLLEPIP